MLDEYYKVNIMQTTDTVYDLSRVTSLRLQILILTRVLHCVVFVTRASCHGVKMKCQSKLDWTEQK